MALPPVVVGLAVYMLLQNLACLMDEYFIHAFSNDNCSIHNYNANCISFIRQVIEDLNNEYSEFFKSLKFQNYKL